MYWLEEDYFRWNVTQWKCKSSCDLLHCNNPWVSRLGHPSDAKENQVLQHVWRSSRRHVMCEWFRKLSETDIAFGLFSRVLLMHLSWVQDWKVAVACFFQHCRLKTATWWRKHISVHLRMCKMFTSSTLWWLSISERSFYLISAWRVFNGCSWQPQKCTLGIPCRILTEMSHPVNPKEITWPGY